MNNQENFSQDDFNASWAEADKMLNRHFRRKKIVFWSVIVLLLVSVTGGMLLFDHSISNSGRQQALPEVARHKPAEHAITQQNAGSKPESNQQTTVAVQPGIQNTASQKLPLSQAQQWKQPIPVSSMAENKTGSRKITATNSVAEKHETFHRVQVLTPSNSSQSAESRSAETEIIPSTAETLLALAPLFPANTVAGGEGSASLHMEQQAVAASTKPYHHGFALLVHGGAYYLAKKLSSAASAEYKSRREKEEDKALFASFGLNAIREGKKTDVSIGIEYACYGEKINYTPYGFQQHIADNSFWESFYVTRTDTDTAYNMGIRYFIANQYLELDSLYHQQLDTSTINSYNPDMALRNGTNRFYYLELPVELRYKFPMGRFELGFGAGLSPALLIRSGGWYIHQDLSRLETVNAGNPVQAFMLNAKAAVDVAYFITPRFKVLIRPDFRTNLVSVTGKDYFARQRYYGAGLRAGLSYSFR